MKISFLVPDISGPVVGPVTVLARALQNHHEVEIVGPDVGFGISPMYRNSFPYVSVPTPRIYRLPDYFWEARKVERAITGDVIVAVKAFPTTIPIALRAKRRRGARVFAYLDEWDGALYAAMSPGQRVARWLREFHHPMDRVYHPMIERMLPRCDGVICTSSFLARKFGGDVVHMGVNTDFFRPRPEAASALRRELGLEKFRLIVFGGVVRPHKGIEQIPEALDVLGREDLRFVIVGPRNAHVDKLTRHPAYGRYVVALGAQPNERMPEFLSMADLIVLPLVDNLLAQSQMPCKVFEAMAMARPIIASAVSDLPDALEDCGWVVPPDDVPALAEQINAVLSDPKLAAARGTAAREKCIKLYSRAVTERRLADIIKAPSS